MFIRFDQIKLNSNFNIKFNCNAVNPVLVKPLNLKIFFTGVVIVGIKSRVCSNCIVGDPPLLVTYQHTIYLIRFNNN